MAETCQCPPEAGAGRCEFKAARSALVCPECRRGGKAVSPLTLKALLAVPLTEVHPVDYGFCRTQDCPVVYFSADGEQQFREQDVRERVLQKHPGEDAIFACYCFRHTTASIRRELAEGQSNVVAAIIAGIESGHCACEIRNPQGSCCLGNVRAVVAKLASP